MHMVWLLRTLKAHSVAYGIENALQKKIVLFLGTFLLFSYIIILPCEWSELEPSTEEDQNYQ